MAESIQVSLTVAANRLAAVSGTAVLDAEVLLCHCLGKNRSFLRAWPEQLLDTQVAERYQSLITQRITGIPVAYLTGSREFWSREFEVTPDVLIPRPDSELLVELGLACLPANTAGKVIDLGTGSGILAITLAAENPLLEVIATDISPQALAVAQRNAQRLKVHNVTFIISDWLQAVQERDVDLICSNPPYIACDDPHLQEGDVRFEPISALTSEDNGLKDIKLIAKHARNHLKCGGFLLVEHGYNQQACVQAIFKEFNYQEITTHQDLSGNPRVTSGLWKYL